MLRSSLLAAATLALATSAQAGGVPTSPQPPAVIAPPAPVEAWTGFYGGVQLEYGRGDIDYGTIPGANFADGDVDGTLYGIFFGYRQDYGSLVFGTEFDYVAGSLDSDTPGITSIDSVMRATLELGVDTGNAFIYGTAGVHGTTVSTTIAMDDMDWGPVYGVGMDYRITERMTVGAELLQHEISDFNSSGADLSFTTLGLNVGFQF